MAKQLNTIQMAFLAFFILTISASASSSSGEVTMDDVKEVVKQELIANEQLLKAMEAAMTTMAAAATKKTNIIDSMGISQVVTPLKCLPPFSPCAGFYGGNCCSNNCKFVQPPIPVGFCG